MAANIDSGLQFVITMGYHQDVATRTAFLKVITNILNQVSIYFLITKFYQGTEFDQSVEGDKYDKLIEVFFFFRKKNFLNILVNI